MSVTTSNDVCTSHPRSPVRIVAELTMKLLSQKRHPDGLKILLAAKLCGREVDVVEAKSGAVLEVQEGNTVFTLQANSAVLHLFWLAKDPVIQNLASVDSEEWLQWEATDLQPVLVPYLASVAAGREDKTLRNTLSQMLSSLSSASFLDDKKVSAASVVVFSSLLPLVHESVSQSLLKENNQALVTYLSSLQDQMHIKECIKQWCGQGSVLKTWLPNASIPLSPSHSTLGLLKSQTALSQGTTISAVAEQICLPAHFCCLLPAGHKIQEPKPLITQIDDDTVNKLKEQFAGQAPPEKKAADPAEIAKLEAQVAEQGAKVRKLKESGTASKDEISAEVTALLSLKGQLAAVQGVDPAVGGKEKKKKGGGAGKEQTKVPPASSAVAPATIINPAEVERLQDLVTHKGDKVRALKKSGTASKEEIAAEVATLLKLKEELALAQGIDPATLKGKDKKKKK